MNGRSPLRKNPKPQRKYPWGDRWDETRCVPDGCRYGALPWEWLKWGGVHYNCLVGAPAVYSPHEVSHRVSAKEPVREYCIERFRIVDLDRKPPEIIFDFRRGGAISTPNSSTATDKTVRLPDGRSLGYAVCGDPEGRPIFQFHGWPGSRLQARFLDEEATKAGIRVIGLDRPGIGLSDFQPGRQILDWPNDVVALADAMKIDRFAVLGISGGGPYVAGGLAQGRSGSGT